MTRPRPELLLPLAALLLVVTQTLSSPLRVAIHSPKLAPRPETLWFLRGGSLDVDVDEEDTVDIDEEEIDGEATDKETNGEVEESEGEREFQDPISSVISSEPVSINFKTNIGSPIIDTSLELLVSRSRNIESVKSTLSRMLPGRPPVDALRLLWGNQELRDDQLVDELVDDDDDEEEATTMTLTLDMVPPVDPKFATQLTSISDLSTSELLDAYTANAAAMYHNAKSLEQFSSPQLDGPLSLELRHQAMRIRKQMIDSWPEAAMQLLEMEVPSSNQNDVFEERRGQRVRSGNGGTTMNLRKSIQLNLNVNWPKTIRNFLLFIFFGVFGGRNAVSRNLLLLGAPLTFFLQARPVKIWLKQAFYAAANPPGIILSLLPAPQQAILSFDESKARQALFGKTLILKEEEEVEQDMDEDEE